MQNLGGVNAPSLPPFVEKIASLPEKMEVLNGWFIVAATKEKPLDPSTLGY